MTTFWEGRDAKVGFVDFCRLTRWIRSASQLTRLSTVGIWLLLRVERLQAGRERGPRERPGGETVLADSEGTSRENRVATTRERRGEEGARKKGWGRAMSPLFLPPMPLRHPARVKCIWKWMRAARCSGDCCGFAGVSGSHKPYRRVRVMP